MRRTHAAALAAALAVALAGCGSEVSSTQQPMTTAAPVTVPPVTVAPVTTPPVTVPPVTAPPVTTPPVTVPPVTVPPTPVTVTVTTRETPAPPPSHLRPGVPVVSPARYRRDVTAAVGALGQFAGTLQGIDSAGEFRASLTSLRTQLRSFDAAIRRLRAYQLANRTLDTQRKKLGQQGPPLAAAMSDFLDAVRDGDTSAATRLAAEVQRRLTQFRNAA